MNIETAGDVTMDRIPNSMTGRRVPDSGYQFDQPVSELQPRYESWFWH